MSNANGLTFRPVPPTTNSGLPKVKDDGSNAAAAASTFTAIARLVLDNYQTFSINDFFALSASQGGIEFGEMKSLFGAWAKQLLKSGQLKEVRGCYDQEIYSVSWTSQV